jgi:hypothetical protein
VDIHLLYFSRIICGYTLSVDIHLIYSTIFYHQKLSFLEIVAHYFTLHFNNIHWMLPPLLFRVMRLFSWSGCCCAASSTERDEAIPSRPRFVSPHFRVKDKFVPRVRHMIYHRKPPWHVVKHMSPCSIRMGGGGNTSASNSGSIFGLMRFLTSKSFCWDSSYFKG